MSDRWFLGLGKDRAGEGGCFLGVILAVREVWFGWWGRVTEGWGATVIFWGRGRGVHCVVASGG